MIEFGNEAYSIFFYCRELPHQLEDLRIRHDFRKQNIVGDLLTREGLRLKDDKYFEECTVPPMFVLKGLKADKGETSPVRVTQPYCNLISCMTNISELIDNVRSYVANPDVMIFII